MEHHLAVFPQFVIRHKLRTYIIALIMPAISTLWNGSQKAMFATIDLSEIE
jgi:hypothetical protein